MEIGSQDIWYRRSQEHIGIRSHLLRIKQESWDLYCGHFQNGMLNRSTLEINDLDQKR